MKRLIVAGIMMAAAARALAELTLFAPKGELADDPAAIAAAEWEAFPVRDGVELPAGWTFADGQLTLEQGGGIYQLSGAAESLAVRLAADVTLVCSNLTLVANEPSRPPLSIGLDGDPAVVTLLLAGKNVCRNEAVVDDIYAPYPTAGIYVPTGSELTIDSLPVPGAAPGSLAAYGADGGAGIGGGCICVWADEEPALIAIKGGEIEARGGWWAAGIGAGWAWNELGYDILLAGGTISARGDDDIWADISATLTTEIEGAITVTGGSIAANIEDYPVDANGRDVWYVEVPVVGSAEAPTVTGLPASYGMKDLRTIDLGGGRGRALCLWLPDGQYDLTVNVREYLVTVDRGEVTVESFRGVKVNDVPVDRLEGEGWRFDASAGKLVLTGAGPFVLSGGNQRNEVSVEQHSSAEVVLSNLVLRAWFPYIIPESTEVTTAKVSVVGCSRISEMDKLFDPPVWKMVGTNTILSLTGGTLAVLDRDGAPAALGEVVITGGSVLANPASAVDATGTPIHCVTVSLDQAEGPVALTGLPAGYAVVDIEAIDGKVYLWLPDGKYDFTANGVRFGATVEGASAETYWIPADGVTARLEDGVLRIEGAGRLPAGGFPWEGKDFTAIELADAVTPTQELIKDLAGDVKLNGLSVAMIRALPAALDLKPIPDGEGSKVEAVDGVVLVPVRLETKASLEAAEWQPVTDYVGSTAAPAGDGVILSVPAEDPQGFFRLAE